MPLGNPEEESMEPSFEQLDAEFKHCQDEEKRELHDFEVALAKTIDDIEKLDAVYAIHRPLMKAAMDATDAAMEKLKAASGQ